MIPQIEPWITEQDIVEVTNTVKSTWITEAGKTQEFETLFKDITKVKYAHAFCNGTATLFTALNVLGIGAGDEVIVPDLTFVATVNAVVLVGAMPVLVDVDNNYQIDVNQIEAKITARTKAILPVHLYGISADMEKIMQIAKKYNLYVIEDAAQAVGVKFLGQHVGTFGEFGSFSFYGNKTITTGEGGMLITNNETLAVESYKYKNHGRLKKGVFIHEKVGFNFSITEMQSALGVSQLKRLNDIIRKKSILRQKYIDELTCVNNLKFDVIDSRCEPVHWFTNIIVDNAGLLEAELKIRGIQTRRFFYPIHKQECYKYLNLGINFPNSEFAYEHCLSLPSSVTLSDVDHKSVCCAIKEILK